MIDRIIESEREKRNVIVFSHLVVPPEFQQA